MVRGGLAVVFWGMSRLRIAGRARPGTGLCAVLAVTGLGIALPAGAAAEQASRPTSTASARLDTGGRQACAFLANDSVRCWGYGEEGELGYGNKDTIGDDETPGSVGPVNLGGGRTATAIGAGDVHTCALLADSNVSEASNVRCWGFGGNGRLGYGNTSNIGDDTGETPGSVAPVDLGAGRPAVSISAGGAHSCVVLQDANTPNDSNARCWGFGDNGELGYGNTADRELRRLPPENIGDDEPAGSGGPVNLGSNRRAVAISAGARHTCALLDDGNVRCWGLGGNGELGYGNTSNIGDNFNETPGTVEPVNLGTGRTAAAISAGDFHTCALLDDSNVPDDSNVRCWGFGGNGGLGYGNTNTIGDDPGETPGSAGPVDLGAGRTAVAISAGGTHTCALLEDTNAPGDSNVRCWGYGASGQPGYGNTNTIGDNETPGSAGPVDLGTGRRATAISAGGRHTCARLDDGNVRCWGYGANGRLGNCSPNNIGDDELPGSIGPIDLETPGAGCPTSGGGGGDSVPTPGTGGDQSGGGIPVGPGTGGAQRNSVNPLRQEALRARALRSCMARAARKPTRERSRGRAACLKRYGRTPARVTDLRARGVSKKQILLSFTAPGTDGRRPPAARTYLVKQSVRPIRKARDFARGQTLCKGTCRFKVTRVGTTLKLTITDLRPGTTYYYAIQARDNVSRRLGPRSKAAQARTR